MQFSSFLLFAVLAVSIARCAPVLDAATLSDNAKKAQKLNAKFVTLKVNDPCQGQETACLNGDIAICVDGKFDTSSGKCAEGQQCFAIPDLRAPGTSLLCTSENTVIGLMKAAGVSGGITGSDDPPNGDNSTSTTSSTKPSTTTSTSPSKSGGLGDDPVTVTVTVFASPLRATTTTTVSPSDASSILGKFLTDGQPSPTSSSSVVLLTPAADPSSTPPASPSGSLSSSGTTSNPTPSPSPNASPSGGILLTALLEEPSSGAPTPTPSPNGVPVGGGGGGGGGGAYGY